MVTASKRSFQLQVRTSYRSQAVMEAERFFSTEEEAWNCDSSTILIEENDEIELLFNAQDRNAKLYVDALYGISVAQEIAVDSEGRWHLKPGEESFFLYKNEAGYEPLCVDVYLITVFCEDKLYYGTLEVKPKQMDMTDWMLMKNDLEEEVRGLAQELNLRNLGFGNKISEHGVLPSEKLAKFLTIKKYAKPVTAAIMDIADKPRSQIVTRYDMVANDRARVFDRETARRYVRTGGLETTRRVPRKTVTYDIPGNRMLKHMIVTYDKILDEFIDWMEEENNYPDDMEFQKTANKLRKLSATLKQKPWYKQVSRYSGNEMSHSFVMDARYNIVYQMYNELRRNDVRISMKPNYVHVWKRSSLLYEMWCFLKVCQMLGLQYTMEEESWERAFGMQDGCPVLECGTTIRFYSKEIELHVQYDRVLPQTESQTDLKDPLYMVKMQNRGIDHNKPDITIQIYSREYDCYIGSVVIECKYRKLHSFWRMDSEWSSIGQMQTYFNNARSRYLYQEMGKRFNINPVHQVIVLTPDLTGNNIECDEFNIIIKSLKPSKEKEIYEELKQVLMTNVKTALENCRFLLGERRR